MQVMCLGWWLRRAPDVERSTTWYRDVLGLPILRPYLPRFVLLHAGETSVMEITGGTRPEPAYTTNRDPHITPYLRTYDLAGAVARLREAGVRILDERIGNEGSAAHLLDPDGHILGLFQPHHTPPWKEDAEAIRRWNAGEVGLPGVAPLGNSIQGFGRVVIRCADVEKVVPFYRDVLGLPVGQREAVAWWFNTGEENLLGILPNGQPQPPASDRTEQNNVMVFRVDDLQGYIDRMRAAGVRFVNEPFESGGGRLCYVADPEENVIGLQERNQPGTAAEEDEAYRRLRARAAA